ncbi:MAG: 2-hydroxyacyl-CoA dehydratase family protein [Syntrophaceae bacterium]
MPDVSRFRAAAEDPLAYARELKKNTGARIVGYMCSYAPEEIIFAAGASPLRLFGASGPIALADAHLQSYCCPLVRGSLDNALSGRLDFLDGAVFPHTCDSIQRLSDIWRLNVRGCFHIDAVLPVKLNTESSRLYMARVIAKFRRDLEEKLGTEITDEKIRAAISLYNAIRRGLKKLYELRAQNPSALRGSDLHAAVKSAMVMERNDYLAALKDLIEQIESSRMVEYRGKRLMLTGGVCSQPDIYGIIEDAGGAVVGDDLCTGSRYFEGMADETGDPEAAIAARFHGRAICPAKHLGIRERGRRLVEAAVKLNADGVIFLLLKFCDPHAFDYPYIKDMLDRAGMPVLLLDIEDRPSGSESLRTRLETFIEMI